MASSLTTFAFAIKDRYTQKKVENLTLADRPFLAMVPKDESFQGDTTHIPLIHGNPQGIAGASLSVAQTNATNVVGKKFQLTVGDYQGSVSIGDKAIKASRGNEGAFLRNKAAEIDGLYEQMADNLATYSYGNGGNSIGVISVLGTDDITLVDASDSLFLEEGMEIVFSTADGEDSGDSLIASGANALVTAVNREDGVISFTAGELASVTGLAVTDFMFREGDFKGDTSTVILFGLRAFLTNTSTPNVLYGMTRTSDPQRLAGSRVPAADIAGRNIEERLQILGSYMIGRYKGPGPTHGFMNPEDWQNLAIALQSRIVAKPDTSTRFGFMALEVIMGGKQVKIYPDRFCPKGIFFALKMNNWKMHSMNKLIHPISEDGLSVLRASTTNDYEHRLVSYPALCTDAPGWSGRVAL